jgi:hypothetical protein
MTMPRCHGTPRIARSRFGANPSVRESGGEPAGHRKITAQVTRAGHRRLRRSKRRWSTDFLTPRRRTYIVFVYAAKSTR